MGHKGIDMQVKGWIRSVIYSTLDTCLDTLYGLKEWSTDDEQVRGSSSIYN